MSFRQCGFRLNISPCCLSGNNVVCLTVTRSELFLTSRGSLASEEGDSHESSNSWDGEANVVRNSDLMVCTGGRFGPGGWNIAHRADGNGRADHDRCAG